MVNRSDSEPLDPLTRRELEILRLIADGLSNQEIASQLFLSYETVKWYNGQVYAKLGVRSRTQAVRAGSARGLLESANDPQLAPPPLPSAAPATSGSSAGATGASDPNLPAFAPTDLRARLYEKADSVLEKPRRLIDREPLLAQIHACLDQGDGVLLHGLGGMGKTSLAAAIAAQRIAAGKGPVIWLEAGHEDARTMLVALARVLGMPQASGETTDERTVAIREGLAQTRGLLVLDNVWNDGALFQVLKAVPDALQLLITSRYAIPFGGVILPVDDLAPEHALELLSHHAHRDYNADGHARSLCQMLGCHPFAVEIAGKRLNVYRHLTPLQLMDRIEGSPHRLQIPGDFADEGRREVKGLLDESLDVLGDDLRTTFVTLGALDAPVVTPGLLAHLLGREYQEVETLLNELQRHGLGDIIPASGDIPEHFRLHDLTYSYAHELFTSQGGDYPALIEALGRYVTACARDYDHLDFEQANILGAAEAAYHTGNDQALIAIMKALVVDGYFDARGHTLLLLERLDDAIEVARKLGPEWHETLFHLLEKRGNAYLVRGDLGSALHTYEEALPLALTSRHRALILKAIGGVRFHQGAQDYETYFEQAHQIATAIGDDVALCGVLVDWGCTAIEKTDYATAHQYLTEAVQVAERIGDAGKLFSALYNLGLVEIELGQFRQALATYGRAYDLARTADNRLWLAYCWSGMARGYHGLGMRIEAQDYFCMAIRLYRKTGTITALRWVISFMQQENYDLELCADAQSGSARSAH